VLNTEFRAYKMYSHNGSRERHICLVMKKLKWHCRYKKGVNDVKL